MKDAEIAVEVAKMEVKFFNELKTLLLGGEEYRQAAGYRNLADIERRVKQMKAQIDKFIRDNEEDT